MTTPTPRTDAMAEDARNIALEFDCRLKPKHGENIFVVGIDFARQLETELEAQYEENVHRIAEQAKAENERDELKVKLETYSDDCAMMDNLRFELAAAKAQRDNWREVAEKLAKVAGHIGYTSVEEARVCVEAERALAAYRKLKEGK